MRLRSLGLSAVLLISSAGMVHANDPGEIYGLWATPKNHGRVEVVPCNGAVCARVVDGKQLRANPDQTDVHNPDPVKRQRRVKGLFILEGYRGGPTQWQGGTVYDPQTGDETNDSTLEMLAPGRLKVEGCKLFFCRSETWTKLSASE
jgi:uncharacterized protein (DUF2147 family)